MVRRGSFGGFCRLGRAWGTIEVLVSGGLARGGWGLTHAEQVGGSGDDFLPVGDEQGGAMLHDGFYGF